MAGGGFHQGSPSFFLDLSTHEKKTHENATPIIFAFLSGQKESFTQFHCKETNFYFILFMCFSSSESQVLSTGTAQDFGSLCPSVLSGNEGQISLVV